MRRAKRCPTPRDQQLARRDVAGEAQTSRARADVVSFLDIRRTTLHLTGAPATAYVMPLDAVPFAHPGSASYVTNARQIHPAAA
jgi:hypothetical protein